VKVDKSGGNRGYFFSNRPQFSFYLQGMLLWPESFLCFEGLPWLDSLGDLDRKWYAYGRVLRALENFRLPSSLHRCASYPMSVGPGGVQILCWLGSNLIKDSGVRAAVRATTGKPSLIARERFDRQRNPLEQGNLPKSKKRFCAWKPAATSTITSC